MKYPPAPLTPFFASLPCIRRRMHILSEPREPKDLNQLSANTTTACSLFALSLQRFRPLACLFSTACSLFCKNTRGGGTRCSIPAIHPPRPPQRAKPIASYHIPVTLALSCDYALFCATATSQTLSRQELAHSFIAIGVAPPACLRDSASTVSPAQGSCYLR
jgi:hypothetical protein